MYAVFIFYIFGSEGFDENSYYKGFISENKRR